MEWFGNRIDQIESIKRREEFFLSPIYFACRARKVIFNLDETSIAKETKLLVSLSSNKEIVKVVIPLYDALTDHKASFAFGRDVFDSLIQNGRLTITLDKSKSSNVSLYFDLQDPTGSYTAQVSPENFIEKCKLFPTEKAEVIYVGKSMRLITDRIKEHRKVLDIIESYEADYSIRFYFISFRILALGSSMGGDHFILKLLESAEAREREFKIDLTERMLVTYFRPELNKTFKNWNYRGDRYVKKIRQEGIETLCLDVGMDAGPLYQFYSKNQLFSSDQMYLNLDNLNEGFIAKENFRIKPFTPNSCNKGSAVMYKSFV